jgi:hypothetical protein
VNVQAGSDQGIEHTGFGVHGQRSGTLPLWVKIHQQDAAIPQGKSVSKGDGRGGFSHAAFLVGNNDAVGHGLILVGYAQICRMVDSVKNAAIFQRAGKLSLPLKKAKIDATPNSKNSKSENRKRQSDRV